MRPIRFTTDPAALAVAGWAATLATALICALGWL